VQVELTVLCRSPTDELAKLDTFLQSHPQDSEELQHVKEDVR
jgi:hypothetical protein